MDDVSDSSVSAAHTPRESKPDQGYHTLKNPGYLPSRNHVPASFTSRMVQSRQKGAFATIQMQSEEKFSPSKVKLPSRNKFSFLRTTKSSQAKAI